MSKNLIDIDKYNEITESELSMTHQSFIGGNPTVISHD